MPRLGDGRLSLALGNALGRLGDEVHAGIRDLKVLVLPLRALERELVAVIGLVGIYLLDIRFLENGRERRERHALLGNDRGDAMLVAKCGLLESARVDRFGIGDNATIG